MISWIKERWELFAGLLLGLLGILALSKNNSKNVLAKKGELLSKTEDVINNEHSEFVDRVDDANTIFDQAVDEIKEKEAEKNNLLNEKSATRREELERLSAEELAERLSKTIEQSIIDHS